MKQIFKLKRLWVLLLFPIGLLLMWLAKTFPYFTEYIYARGAFKIGSQILAFLTGWLPFSLAEWLIILAPFAVVTVLAWWIVGIVRHKGETLFRVAKGGINVLCVGALVYFVYATGCGMNYHRYPFADLCGLTVEPATGAELADLCRDLAAQANALREDLPEDENGVYQMTYTIDELGDEVLAAYKNAAKKLDILGGTYPAPKAVFFSRTMSRTELTGIYTCFTMEANVNVDVTDYCIASTMCHEEAHLRGFIREDEANYIAWLVCSQSDSPEIRYSGVLDALVSAGNALYGKNADLYNEVRGIYSAGVNRDLSANSAYWKQFEDTVISNTTTTLNDVYLKANDQEDGVQSYGRMVDLLIAEYRAKKETSGE